MTDSKLPVVFLMGPTASGKTGLAVELVQAMDMDIVSVDSALVYRGMDIGTAKPDAQTQAKAPHRLIDILDPAESYSAARFTDDARREIAEVHAQGRIPLLVGGTMLYFRALQQGLSPMPSADAALREAISQQAEEQGWPALHARLAEVDPQAARRIHPNDAQRIQRALEIVEVSGQGPSDWHASRPQSGLPWPLLKFALSWGERSLLRLRIAARFEQMMTQGLLAEVEGLHARSDLTLDSPSMRCVGYRQLWQHLDGEYDLKTAVQRGITASHQLAKRQMTWLRKEPELHWLEPDLPQNMAKVLACIEQRIKAL